MLSKEEIKERQKESHKRWYEKNKGRVNEIRKIKLVEYRKTDKYKAYLERSKKQRAENHKKYLANHPEKTKARRNDYFKRYRSTEKYKEHRKQRAVLDRGVQRSKRYRERHPERAREWDKRKRERDPVFQLRELYRSLQSGGIGIDGFDRQFTAKIEAINEYIDKSLRAGRRGGGGAADGGSGDEYRKTDGESRSRET